MLLGISHYVRRISAVKTVPLLAMALLLGCTAQYTGQLAGDTMTTLQLKNQHQILRSSDWRLPMDTRLFLARPQFARNLTADSTQLPRSRTLLHSALEMELKSHFPDTTVAWDDLNFDEALGFARMQRSQVMVYPLFVEFNDRLNSWAELNEGKALHPEASYGRDHAIFEILLVETYTGDILDSAKISSKQRFFASSDQPLKLYSEAAQKYVALLSGRVSHTERPR